MATPEPPQSPVSIDSLVSSGKLVDFDDPAHYRTKLDEAVRADTRNFVVRFGEDKAQIAIDVDHRQLHPLLALKDRGDYPLCWINVWDPSLQREIVRAIGTKYAFSDRLQRSITIWDEFKWAVRESQRTQQASGARTQPSPPPGSGPEKDLEQGGGGAVHVQHPSSPPQVVANPLLQPESQATFKLLQSSLNYTTIDQGDDFICIGANWLHRSPEPKSSTAAPNDVPLVPPKHWSWFALCGDNTVISFHESPVYDIPEGEKDPAEWQRRELANMRSNTKKVLRHLSNSKSAEDSANFLQLVDVRRLLKARNTSTHQVGRVDEAERRLDCASNLFYYLFEDYAAAIVILGQIPLVLEQLRSGVFERQHNWKKSYKKDTTIRQLHILSMELRKLRHLFGSYKVLISRLLDPKPASQPEESGQQHPTTANAERLSKRARDRFQRLSDRMQLLMLNPIQEYLDEKTSLSDTYFNLTAQKDSEATARLTRSATLLAKLSVFFIPITFMTSFFSVEIPDLLEGYTAQTYWGVIGVTAGISFVCLFFFSRVLMWASLALDESTKRATRSVMGFIDSKRATMGGGSSDS